MNEFRSSGSVVDELAGFEWGSASGRFLGLPEEQGGFAESRIVILPVPYEATVSYMSGTKFGPKAILEASRYLELYDHELDSEPYGVGVFTLPELQLSGGGPEEANKELRKVFERLLDLDKLVIMLGGEHSITAPPVLCHADRMDGRLSVLQLDAHADLRAEYEGTPFSHACVMHRVHGKVDVVPVGIRSLTRQEMDLVRAAGIPVIFGHELDDDELADRVLDSLGPDVYLTFDVDYFDPSLMPATGTPEPGGGSWRRTVELLERVFRERNVVGCDVVELSPIPGLVAPDFAVAKLVYKLIGFAESRG